ncbi:MAG: ParB/RepB/Spo0J family partition protein [Hyphomicrobiaceae bacterium]|nr:ParB/RepB/Spo0J family partition protein [Hyphomicrobiaceae bacterium]
MTMKSVPYSSLSAPAAINAREADGYKDVDDLAALIDAKGLLQPLIVREVSKGQFEVMAGKRRYHAIGKLIKQRRWAPERTVDVNIRDENDEQALETSLIENIGRKPMHPVQEFEVFARLFSGGANAGAIAHRYGVTTAIVRQRLALGSLAPAIRKAWRDGKINAETAQAFALCRDAKKQAKAFKAFADQGFISAQRVRTYFTQDRAKINDPRLLFVGIDKYKAAGGKVVESLFDNDGYIEDQDLLDQLVDARLTERCAELVADGWQFAVLGSTLKSGQIWSWPRIEGARKAYTPEEKVLVAELKTKIDALEKSDNQDDDAYADACNARDAIEEAAALRGYTKAQKAQSGCILTIDGGVVEIRHGVIRDKTPASKAADPGQRGNTDGDSSTADSPEDAGAHISQALLADITALQTAAVAEALAQNPLLAIRVAAAALAPVPAGYYGTSPVRITVDGMAKDSGQSADDTDGDDDGGDNGDVQVLKGFAAAFEAIPQSNAAATLAHNLGRALDLRQLNHKKPDVTAVDVLVGSLPGAVYLKAMRANFDPVDYFNRASAKVATAALAEMGIAMTDKAAKKPVVASAAAQGAKELGWLPVELRHPVYALFGTKRPKAA